MAVLRSLAFYALFYGISILYVIAAVVVLVVHPAALRTVVHHWSNWHRWCARTILNIRVEVEGEVPEGPVLIAIKHESFFEAIDVPCLLGTPAPFAKRELFWIPGWGVAARAYGAIPVDREQGVRSLRAMLRAAQAIIASNRSIAIFPEGTRVPHGQSPKLRGGFVALYKQLELPVVPIAVNSGPLYHRRWKKPGVLTYRIAQPIPPGLPRREIEARVHAAINALNAPERSNEC